MAQPSVLITELKDTIRYFNVVRSFVGLRLKERYRRSALGVLWTILAPMSQYLVIGLVFSFANRIEMEGYFTFLFSGSVCFGYISSSITRSMHAYVGNELFIKKIYLPKLVFSLQGVLCELANLMFAVCALVLLGAITGQLELSWSIAFLPIALCIITAFLVGVSIVIATASVYFRDLFHIIPAVLQAAFFATPILYPIDILPIEFQRAMGFNPFYYFVELFRYPIYRHSLPQIEVVVASLGFALLGLVCGFWILMRFQNRIVFKL